MSCQKGGSVLITTKYCKQHISNVYICLQIIKNNNFIYVK